mmetsp:Transcript_9491/g.19084  ORF Transcript_9491/g.19084 Transcript_9491/m.19084 type:complete len:759 (-) Transcript_9491:2242-4518(-)
MNAREEETKNGHPKRRRRSDGVGKPKAHKKGGGNTSGQSKTSYRDYRRHRGNNNALKVPPDQQQVVAHPNSGRQNNTRRKKPKKANNKVNKQLPQSKRKGEGRGANRNTKTSSTLQPISCPSSSIMRGWKQALGPLIRYYVGFRCKEGVSQKDAEDEIDKMYFKAGCGKEETKLAILQRLGMKETDKDLVNVTMIIEKDEQMVDVPTSKESNDADDSMIDGSENVIYTETRDGKGLKLKQIIQRGEGPAHSHESWTNVIIPDFAVGKSFFFECKNNANIPLSCELFLDGTKVAFNAPLPSNSDRSIKPDNPRYSHRHQWILAPAKRVKLQPTTDTAVSTTTARQPAPAPTPRYNHIRPDYEEQRVNEQLYPDATSFGWTFTGSQQASRVEFFEKTLNIGLVKLDFYYTTGTVKTTLYHPSTGRNQLFRGGLNPEQYAAVLNNPRAHTNQGYRRRVDRPDGQVVADDLNMNEDMSDDDEFDQHPNQDEAARNDADDLAMEEGGDAVAAGSATYYAKNDGYNFNRQGHYNRRTEMNKLQNSQQYSHWREANMAEYSVITAKFYVSIPRRQQGGQVNLQQQRRKKDKELLPIPNQSSVVDIKAAERATIGTKFEPTGPSQCISKSYVRMERIHGLSDEKDWKGEPVFEKKLYYRAEHIVKRLKMDGDEDDDDVMSEEDNADDDDGPSHNTTLAKYKDLMVEKVQQHRPEMDRVFPQDDAEMKIRHCIVKIYGAESAQDVDDQIRLFLDEFFPGQFNKTWNV